MAEFNAHRVDTRSFVEARPTEAERLKRVALEAAWEADSITHTLIDFAKTVDASDLVVRSLVLRLRDLNEIIADALGNDDETSAALVVRLTGERKESRYA